MKRDDLTKLGLDNDETIDAIMALHGKDIEKHKSTADTFKVENETLKGHLKEAGETIEGFKKLDPEALKKAVDDYKVAAEKAKTDADTQIAALKFDHALDGALATAKAKNPKAVKALLKSEDLKLAEDGSIVGLQEQLEKVKTDNDYLFDSDTPTPTIVAGGQNKSVPGSAFEAAVLKGAELQEQGK
jgi:DNA-directed RNA polymerase subunit F